MTFRELETANPDSVYELEERASIHEFLGGLPRIEAEIRTVREFQAFQNKDRWTQLKLEAGLI